MLEMHAWRDALITIGRGRLHCFLAHLLRLGPEERLQRFCYRVDDAGLRAYVAGLDLAQRKIIGCFEGEQMRAAAELGALGAAPLRLVEAAFSVEKAWCGQGVERALILRTITAARSMGARQLFLDRLGASEALRHAVAQFDADMVFGSDDCRAWLPLTPV
jgi:GNAT superfamily N-acetyltransferase